MNDVFKKFYDNLPKLEKTISDKILIKPSINKYKSFKNLILNSKNHIRLAINYNVVKNKKTIDYTEIFNDQEIKYMAEHINNIPKT